MSSSSAFHTNWQTFFFRQTENFNGKKTKYLHNFLKAKARFFSNFQRKKKIKNACFERMAYMCAYFNQLKWLSFKIQKGLCKLFIERDRHRSVIHTRSDWHRLSLSLSSHHGGGNNITQYLTRKALKRIWKFGVTKILPIHSYFSHSMATLTFPSKS